MSYYNHYRAGNKKRTDQSYSQAIPLNADIVREIVSVQKMDLSLRQLDYSLREKEITHSREHFNQPRIISTI